MNVTLDNTIVLTERLLQLSAVKRKSRGATVCPCRSGAGGAKLLLFPAGARSSGYRSGYDGVQQPVMIEGDDVLLGELCANLLENAIKYTPEQGIVTVYLRTANDAVELSVEDSGPGIAEDQIPGHAAVSSSGKRG